MSKGLSRYDIKKANSHVTLKLRGEVQNGGVPLRVTNILVIQLSFYSILALQLGMFIL